MGPRITKPWLPLTADAVGRLPGQLGVYELADDQGRVLYVGYAGGRSLFGFRSEIAKHLGGAATRFRYEVNMQYQSRYRELLMRHAADNGDLPEMNRASRPAHLGRLSQG
ncbi:MAG: DUF7508 domain-containing protein [Tepidiformaceae bacterium]